jgi:hypothetical protein
MDKWNTGPFDNEEAAELLEDIKEGAVPLKELLPTKGHRYLESDHGALVVAMAHLAGGNLPEGISDEEVAELQTPEAKELLRQSLEAVLSDGAVSGLYTEWQQEGEAKLHEWKAKSHIELA